MKLSYDADNQEIFANDSIAAEVMDYFTSAAKDKCIEFHTELARRVNGWEEVIGFIKHRARICCCKEINEGYCETCKAREVLRKVGE